MSSEWIHNQQTPSYDYSIRLKLPFVKHPAKSKYQVLGTMSGSSLDGLDMALCEWCFAHGRWEMEFIKTHCQPYPDSWIEKLKHARQLDSEQLNVLENEYSQWCADQIFDEFASLLPGLDLIASHGHTVKHNPAKGYSLQLGSASILSDILKKPVVNNFRIADIRAGGQGAPLVPILERDILHEYDAFINLGGIVNLSYREKNRMMAGDVWGCNQILNGLVNPLGMDYDEGGQLASTGKHCALMWEAYSSHPYSSLPFPKSLDNHYVIEEWLFPWMDSHHAINDLLYTCCQFIGHSIAKILPGRSGSGKIMVTGGGAHNLFLVEQIQQALASKSWTVVVPDKAWVDYKEAALMSYMGLLRCLGEYNTIPESTGAKKAVIAGDMVIY